MSIRCARQRPLESPTLWPRAAWLTRLFGITADPADPRFTRLQEATRYGDPLADALVGSLTCDPDGAGRAKLERAIEHGLANVAQPAPVLARLFEQLEATPEWLDRARVARGAEVMLRQGPEGLCALSAVSLMGGYLSSCATKPLAWTGALVERTPQRLFETTQFVFTLMTSGELSRDSPAFKAIVRVRLMHARVRAQLLRDPAWEVERWGIPINQRDMVATHLTFTVLFMVGAMALGRLLSADERDAVMHLFRYVSYLLGTPDALVPKTFREGVEVGALLNISEPGPDHDSRALAEALVRAWREGPRSRDAPRRQRLFAAFMLGYTRFALGPEAACRLALPESAFTRFVPILACARLGAELRRLLTRGGTRASTARSREILERRLGLKVHAAPTPHARAVSAHAAN